MNILFLPKYDRKSASTRYRFMQYFPALEARGIHYTVSPFFDDEYLHQKFARGRACLGIILRSYLRRLKIILSAKKYDLLVIHSETLPYCPAVLEWYLRRRHIPYVFDYDDAIFHNYDQSGNFIIRLLLSNKIKNVARHASFITAGCAYLMQHARQVNDRVKIMPTVIDLETYSRVRLPVQQEGRTFNVGWIGSPSTTEYLHVIHPALQALSKTHDLVLTLVGAQPITLEGVRVKFIDWAEETEIDEVLQFDVGIMPLPDLPWTRGKCGFKLIQYMACGLPVIASPVGVNTEIVQHGVNGFLCETSAQWQEALTCLMQSPALRARMGNAGRKRVEAHYCKQVLADEMLRIFEMAARRPG